MKRKKYERHCKRVKRLAEKWTADLGLYQYRIVFNFYDKEKEFKKSNHSVVAMRVYADWRYMDASVDVNVPAVSRLDDDELEDRVVHELCHVLVNEMRETGMDHEERVTTMLTKAFRWVRSRK